MRAAAGGSKVVQSVDSNAPPGRATSGPKCEVSGVRGGDDFRDSQVASADGRWL